MNINPLSISQFVFLAVALTSVFTSPNARAETIGNAPTAKESPSFGTYTTLSIESNIVKDVKVTDTGRIFLLLNPDFKENEIILKNSMGHKSGYRKWFNGELELVSPVNQGKAPNEYTDWVETTANYIEYYMEGTLILHLGKKSVVEASK